MKRLLAMLFIVVMVFSLAACGGGSGSGGGSAEPEDNFPEDNLTLVLPNASGGTLETNCRNWQPFAEEALGTNIEFNFVEGGGGIIAVNTFLGAGDDCYTMFIDTFNQSAIAKLMYDAEYSSDDFAYLGAFSYDPGIFFVKKDAPYNTFDEFIEYVKGQPEGTVTIGLASLTDMGYVIFTQLEEVYGVKFNFVNYSGGKKARQALVNGEVDSCCSTWFACSSIKDDIKVLAITADTDKEYEGLEGVKGIRELTGHDELGDCYSAFFLAVPAKAAEAYPERYAKLCEIFGKVWTSDEFMKFMEEKGDGQLVNYLTPEEVTAKVKEVEEIIFQFADLLTAN